MVFPPALLRGLMICDICGHKSGHIRYVTRSFGNGTDLFIIENVPIVSCPHCGASYLTAEALHEIERIKLHRDGFVRERSVKL